MKRRGTHPIGWVLLAVALTTGGAPAIAAKGNGCGDSYTPVSRIQGAGDRSPLAGQVEVVEGIVAGSFPGRDGLSGFYLESTEQARDRHGATSEGLFVHVTRPLPGYVSRGNRVRVRGKVTEFHGLTELTRVRQLQHCGPATLSPPQPLPQPPWNDQQLERLEGMRVSVEPLTVIDHYQRARFGVLELAPERLWNPTQLVPPGPESRALAGKNRHGRILLDDGSLQTRPHSPYERDRRLVGNDEGAAPLRLGDQVAPFEAILDYRFDRWRLQPVADIRIRPENRRPEPLPQPDGLRFAALNLNNFFNGNGRGGDFPTSRGAKTRAEYQQQKAGLTAQIRALNADLVVVSELENDGFGPTSAVADLTSALGGDWAFVDFSKTGTGSDAITNGILYRAGRLELTGRIATLDTGAFSSGNRPALAAAFRGGGSDELVEVVANHFKSKRCQNASGRNAEAAPGAGCWGQRRAEAASELLGWLGSDPTGSAPSVRLLMGDFNSYRQEPPSELLRQGGFHNPLKPDDYTYVYDGQLGALDAVWVSGSASDRVSAAGAWHGNVDEAPDGNDQGAQPWGVSDHDPVWVDLKTNGTEAQ